METRYIAIFAICAVFLFLLGCPGPVQRQTEAAAISQAVGVPVSDSSNTPTKDANGIYTFSWNQLPNAENYGILVYASKADALSNKNMIGMGVASGATTLSITSDHMRFTSWLVPGQTYAYSVVGVIGQFDGNQKIVSGSTPYEFVG